MGSRGMYLESGGFKHGLTYKKYAVYEGIKVFQVVKKSD